MSTVEYIEELEREGVPPSQAKAHARALEAHVISTMATKADLAGMRADIKADIERAELRIVVRLGGFIIAVVALAVAVIKLF